MTRTKKGLISKKKHKKILKKAKGYYGARSKVFRVAKQAVIKAGVYAYIGRKQKKRNFRRLWISRINAATRIYGFSYSTFINKLKKINLIINRKSLSEMAVKNNEVFNKLIEKIKNV